MMYFGIKSRIAIFLLIILFFSILVYAGGIPEIMNETNITDLEIHNFNFSNFTVYEVNITNISFGNRPPLVEREVLDLSIEEIYFDNDLKLNEELFLVVKVKSDSRSEVTAGVIVEVTGEKEFQNKKTFTEKREITFTKEAEISFGPIVFEEAGDYEIISEIKSSALEKDRNNNELTGLFFFPFLSCEDGTYIGECNEDLLYCENGEFIEKCSICGCGVNFVCVEEICIEKEMEDNRSSMVSFIYGPDGLIASDDGEIKYYIKDNLGSTRVLVNGDGEIVAKKEYLPFGDVFNQMGETDGFDYIGKEEDASGLKYLGARYYDSSLGRFTGLDPIKSGLNHYVYASNNPINRKDINGLFDYGVNSEQEFNYGFIYSEGIGIKNRLGEDYLESAMVQGIDISYRNSFPANNMLEDVVVCSGLVLGQFTEYVDKLESDVNRVAVHRVNVLIATSGGNLIANRVSDEAKSKIDIWFSNSGPLLVENWQNVYKEVGLVVETDIRGLPFVPDVVSMSGFLFPGRIHGFSWKHAGLKGDKLIKEVKGLTRSVDRGENPDPFAWSGVVFNGGSMDRQLNPHDNYWPDLQGQGVKAELMYLF